MTSAELAARYRGYAIRCWLFAKQQHDVSDKRMLIDMAQAWVTLADNIQKNESLCALFVAPDPERCH